MMDFALPIVARKLAMPRSLRHCLSRLFLASCGSARPTLYDLVWMLLVLNDMASQHSHRYARCIAADLIFDDVEKLKWRVIEYVGKLNLNN
jgi:hypothetical protein